MSTFRRMFEGLRDEVRSRKYVAIYDGARERHSALEDHDTIASVLGVLAREGQKTYAEKELLTRALIAEQQSSSSSFWSAALLVAYYPLLSRLRGRIYGDILPDEDLDQLVITSFLAVARDYPIDVELDRTALRLRQRTERRVFAVLRDEREVLQVFYPLDQAPWESLERIWWPDVADGGQPGPRNAIDAADAVSFLVEHTGDLLDGETFDVVTTTLVCHRRIRTFVESRPRDLSPAARKREQQRVKRRHSRALARVRPALEHLRCPRDDGDGLCHWRDSDQQEVTE